MGMTETQQVLVLLRDDGACTVDEVVSLTGIPVGRVVAALGALQRAGNALKDRRADGTWYTPTEAGRDLVASWEASAARGAGRA